MDNTILTKSIMKLLDEDQKNIQDFRDKKIDQNTLLETSAGLSKKFIDILNQFGFPYKNICTDEIYTAAITLALHVDLRDMQDIFNRYIDNSSTDEVSLPHKATFIDKIKVLNTEPQLYGTQYKIKEDGATIELLPVDDLENLEKRRRAMGLS